LPRGQRLFEVDDRTFSDAGQIGLWTKADSVTLFDQIEIQPLHECGANFHV